MFSSLGGMARHSLGLAITLMKGFFMTSIITGRHVAVMVAATAMVATGFVSAATAGNSNNASAGNDRTMTTQYSATLLPIGGTMGERNRWDVSPWTGVTTRTASNPHEYRWGFSDRDYYQRGMYYRNGQPYKGDWKSGW